jgi:phospholipid transport system substrate-binding protein
MRFDYLPYLLALALLSLLNGMARAADTPSQLSAGRTAGVAAVDGESPAALIEDTVEELLGRMKADTGAEADRGEQVYALVTDIVVPHLDMTRIARIVLGKHSRRVDAGDLTEFTGEFRTLLVRTYATSLLAYRGGHIEVRRATQAPVKGTATVDVRVHRSEGAPVELSFLAHNRSGPWLVYDIRIEGVSLVSNYRSEFATILRSQGMGGLIKTLRNRNRQAQLAASLS